MRLARRWLAGILVLGLVMSLPAAASASIPVGKRIGGGAFHAAALREDGVLFAWGANGLGAFGNSSIVSSPTPVVGWGGLATGKSVWGTYYGSSVVNTAGGLLTSGDNSYGALGTGSASGYSSTPATVTFPVMGATVNSVASGFYTQLAVMSNGQLYAWGNNQHGQFGNGGTDSSANSTPVRVGTDSDWRWVSAGRYHVAAVKTNGTLWAWGYNLDGQVGNGLSGAGAPDVTSPYQVGTDTDWVAVFAMADGTVALKSNGRLYAWGRNNWGQLGLGHATNPWPTVTEVPTAGVTGTRWVNVAVGYQHVLATRDDGSLWAWGRGETGQLGNGSTTLINPTPVPVSLSGVRQLTAGEDWSMALTSDEWVWTWGHNVSGQLGVASIPTGAGSIRTTPIQVMNLHVAPPAPPVVTPPAPAAPSFLLPNAPSVVKRGSRFSVSGLQQPWWRVTLRFYRLEKGVWKLKYRYVTHTHRGSRDRFERHMRLSKRGQWMVKAERHFPRVDSTWPSVLGEPVYITVP